MDIVRRLFCKIIHTGLILASKFFSAKGRVLMLHWIGNETLSGDVEEYRISIESFKTLLEWLKKHKVIRLENWEKEKFFFAITIDDVPENFYCNAFPLLKEADIPFTVFVNISLLDKDGYISTKQLKEISKCELCTIGSHGYKHDFFCKLDKEETIKDLNDSQKELEQIIGRKIDLYAFPYGSFYACGFKHKHLVLDYYKYGFGTVATPISNPSLLPKYFIPRMNINERMISNLK